MSVSRTNNLDPNESVNKVLIYKTSQIIVIENSYANPE